MQVARLWLRLESRNAVQLRKPKGPVPLDEQDLLLVTNYMLLWVGSCLHNLPTPYLYLAHRTREGSNLLYQETSDL